ncbi:MAG TPA: HAD hydrolase-like protein [Vicinamibacterales bacterium]|nr:HAD hydrolase-like protein [Vicinamibacterales bacterium]
MAKLVLFDIDGTLVLTGGAGVRAMNRALEATFGVPDALRGIPVAGRTDWGILDEAVRKQGGTLDAAMLAGLQQRYVRHLADEMRHDGEGPKGVMPGIREILDRLAGRGDVMVGLLTGNFEAGARIKLEYFDLWRYFRCGAFGSDAADRNLLVPFAVRRARLCGFPDIAPGEVLVVGDTPADVGCAHAAGATAIAVATGPSTVEELRATGAEHVFADLGEIEPFLRLVDAE